MPEKHYDNDPSKAKSRALVRDEIKSTLLAFRRPKDIRVACFAGPEAREVIEVYDELSIPRENVTSFERGEMEYRKMIENANGINAVNEDIFDYIRDKPYLPFDVVSLDFTQNYTIRLSDDIIKLIGKLSQRNFLFHLAVLAKRENDESKKTLSNFIKIVERSGRLFDIPEARSEEDMEKLSLKEIRDESFSIIFESAINYSDSTVMYRNMERALGQEYARELFERAGGSPGKSMDYIRSVFSREPNTQVVLKAFIEETLHKMRRYGCDPNRDAVTAIEKAVLLGVSNARSLVARKRRYYYISESGSPMIGDICFASRCDKLMVYAGDFLGSQGYPDSIFDYFNEKRALESLKSYNDAYNRSFRREESEREFLGSSYKGPKKKEAPKKPYVPTEAEQKEVVEYLREGFPIKEILDVFPQFTDYQLRGYRAAITSGKY